MYKMLIFGIIAVIIVLISGFYGGYMVIKDEEENWNRECREKGLGDKCTPEDECKKNCLDLKKTFYKFEGGGFLEDDNCWCLDIDDNTVQIW